LITLITDIPNPDRIPVFRAPSLLKTTYRRQILGTIMGLKADRNGQDPAGRI